MLRTKPKSLLAALVCYLDGARDRRDYTAIIHWYGYIGSIRYGHVRIFRLPLRPCDHLGLPKQPWLWNAYLRLDGTMLYVEGAQKAPPVHSLRNLLELAQASGADEISLDRLRNGETVTHVYNLTRMLGPRVCCLGSVVCGSNTHGVQAGL